MKARYSFTIQITKVMCQMLFQCVYFSLPLSGYFVTQSAYSFLGVVHISLS